MKVSIIVPTYNRPEFLGRALRSIAGQTYDDYEVLVVNDGGVKVNDIYADYNLPGKLINHRKNHGLPWARNTGIRVSTGDYIAYLDDDDWWYSHHLQTCIDAIRATGKRWVYTNSDAYGWKKPGARELFLDRDYSPESIKKHNITPVLCVVHTKEILKQTGLFNIKLKNHEDYDMWLRMAQYEVPYHIKKITACVDRSHISMVSNNKAIRAGMEIVKKRYESATLLPAEPTTTQDIRQDDSIYHDPGLELSARSSIRERRQAKRGAARLRQSDRKAQPRARYCTE